MKKRGKPMGKGGKAYEAAVRHFWKTATSEQKREWNAIANATGQKSKD